MTKEATSRGERVDKKGKIPGEQGHRGGSAEQEIEEEGTQGIALRLLIVFTTNKGQANG